MTATTRTISCDGVFETFAKWKHPTDVQAKNIFKYNTEVTVANASLAATITSVALACLTSFAMLGIVLTAISGLSYILTAATASKTLTKLEAPRGWAPFIVEISGTPIAVHRCFPTNKVTAHTTVSVPVEVREMDEVPFVEIPASSISSSSSSTRHFSRSPEVLLCPSEFKHQH